MVERQLTEIDLAGLCQGRQLFPSPVAWEDQVLYFLLVDRFSDGQEIGYRDVAGNVVAGGTTPLFQPADAGNAVGSADDAARWRSAGAHWVGGTLRGVISKIGYLRRMGITGIWVSPIFHQVTFQDTYHGYGIQNFLDVDPHYGTREDLRELVRVAHENGIYVILDVILNHTGNVFSYDPDRYSAIDANGQPYLDARWDGRPYRVKGYNAPDGQPGIPFGAVDVAAFPAAWPGGAVWPAELQDPNTFHREGHIVNWDYDPEFRDGDFSDLKDVDHGNGSIDGYQPSSALRALCTIYKFWIAFADLDGFRIDTVKHVDPGAARFFASAIHEFAQSIGKENFYLLGEITGGRVRAYDTLEVTGLDAALGIDDTPTKLEGLVKGQCNPADYFDLFRNSLLVQKDSHVWFRNKIVTTFDDHDEVRQDGYKMRFCAGDPTAKKLMLALIALNATTLGIPCMYYGSEQLFDGQGDNDRYIREAMFGGEFGAFRTRQRHFFDETAACYQEIAKVLDLRRQRLALRRGRQYLREISGDGVSFGLPQMIGGQIRSIVPWSRIFADREVLLAINTEPSNASSAWVTVDSSLHRAGDQLRCLYSTDAGQIDRRVDLMGRNGLATFLGVPPAGFVIYE